QPIFPVDEALSFAEEGGRALPGCFLAAGRERVRGVHGSPLPLLTYLKLAISSNLRAFRIWNLICCHGLRNETSPDNLAHWLVFDWQLLTLLHMAGLGSAIATDEDDTCAVDASKLKSSVDLRPDL